jgi:Flp pilus assembly protein protease CpaA
MTNDVKAMTDGAAVVVGFGGFMGWMTPAVTFTGGVLTIIWLALRIYETATVQKMLGKKEGNNAQHE